MHVRRSLYAYLGLLTASVTIAPLCVMAQTMPPVAKIPTFDTPAPVVQTVPMPPMGVDGGMCNAEDNYQTIQSNGSFTRIVANGDEEKVWYATWGDQMQYWIPTKVVKYAKNGGNITYRAEYFYSPSPINLSLNRFIQEGLKEKYSIKIEERFAEMPVTTTKAKLLMFGTNPTDASRRTEMNYEECAADLLDQIFPRKK